MATRDGWTDNEWAALMRRFRITDIRDKGAGWVVESTSGSTYHVHMRTRMDEMGSYYGSWECDCPARKRCRHIEAVEDMRGAEELAHAQETGDYDGMELLTDEMD